MVNPVLNASGSTRMEPWLRAGTTRGVAFETAYPQSWAAEPVEGTHDASGIHIRLADGDQDKLYAYILVHAQRRAAIAQESRARWLGDALAMLRRSGLVDMGSPREVTEADDPRTVGVEGWCGGYQGEGRVGEADLDWRLGFVARDEILFTVALYSPKRAEDLLSALRARRAFEIVRATLDAT